MTDQTSEARLTAALAAVEEILAEYGLRTYDRDGIHRWRCEYPDRYGPCECFADMMQAIRDAFLAADPTLAADLALAAAVRTAYMEFRDDLMVSSPSIAYERFGKAIEGALRDEAAKEASEPDASSAGADGTATRPEGQGPTSTRNGPKPGGTP